MGHKRQTVAVNQDIAANTNSGVVHDLNKLRWPRPHKHSSEVPGYDVIEHLERFITTPEEIHRVCCAGALVSIPHFSCAKAFTSPTHLQCFDYFTMNYVTGENDLQFSTRAGKTPGDRVSLHAEEPQS